MKFTILLKVFKKDRKETKNQSILSLIKRNQQNTKKSSSNLVKSETILQRKI